MYATVKSLYFNHPSQGNSTSYYNILGLRNEAAPPISPQIGHFPPKRVKYRHRHPFFFFFLPHPQKSCLSSQPIRGKVRQIGRTFPEYAERSFLDSEHTVVAVRRISRTRFAKQAFAQLRTNHARRTFFRFDKYPELGSRSRRSPN